MLLVAWRLSKVCLIIENKFGLLGLYVEIKGRTLLLIFVLGERRVQRGMLSNFSITFSNIFQDIVETPMLLLILLV